MPTDEEQEVTRERGDDLTMLVPPYVSATIRGPFGEGKVIPIPVGEFTDDLPVLVDADDFPEPSR